MALGFADDTILFVQASNRNINKCMQYIALFSLAAGMNLNLHKSHLIDINAENFNALIWAGKRMHQGQVFRHLGYPIGVNVTNQQLTSWVAEKVQTKIASWYCDEWPLHVRLRIVQSILVSYLLYYIPLLNWKPAHLGIFETAFKRFLWGKKGKTCAFIKWDLVCQPKNRGGLGVLNLAAHAHARRATMLKHMFSRDTLWARCMWQIIGYSVVYFHGSWDLSDWDKLFSHVPLKTGCQTAQMFIIHGNTSAPF